MKKVLGVVIVAVSMMTGGAAHAVPSQFDSNDAVWGCGPAEGVPPNHCINRKSQGNTGLIRVFAPDERGPAESISTDPKSDSRPCPHDDVDGDGTWWSPLPGLWVCHHRPVR